eukprot:g16177.t1
MEMILDATQCTTTRIQHLFHDIQSCLMDGMCFVLAVSLTHPVFCVGCIAMLASRSLNTHRAENIISMHRSAHRGSASSQGVVSDDLFGTSLSNALSASSSSNTESIFNPFDDEPKTQPQKPQNPFDFDI